MCGLGKTLKNVADPMHLWFTPKVPKPDAGIGIAADKQAALGEDMLNFSKTAYADLQKRQGTTDQLVADYTKKAADWDSAENQQLAATKAGAGVRSAAEMSREGTNRRLMAYGVNPNSGRFAGINRAADIDTGLGVVGAENTARDTLRTQGMDLDKSAIGLNMGDTSQAASLTSIPFAGYQGAQAGYANEANTLNGLQAGQIASYNAAAAADSQKMQTIGSLAGIAAAFF